MRFFRATRLLPAPRQRAGVDAEQPLGILVEPAEQLQQVLTVEHPQIQIHLAREELVRAGGQRKLRLRERLGVDGVGKTRKFETIVRLIQGLGPLQATLIADDAFFLQLPVIT